MENPITAFAKEANFLPNELAGYLCMSGTRFKLLEKGAFDRIPKHLHELAEEVRGEGGGDRLEAEYDAFKAETLTFDERMELQQELYPAGRVHGMCP